MIYMISRTGLASVVSITAFLISPLRSYGQDCEVAPSGVCSQPGATCTEGTCKTKYFRGDYSCECVPLKTQPKSFVLTRTQLTPTPLKAGDSATSTITASPLVPFTGTVTLSCDVVVVGRIRN